MPQKNIYLSAEDLEYIRNHESVFNESLSSIFMKGYRKMVEENENSSQGLEEVKLSILNNGMRQYKIFIGKIIARERQILNDRQFLMSQRIYRTRKNQWVYYKRIDTNWNYWNQQDINSDNGSNAHIHQEESSIKIVDHLEDLEDIVPDSLLRQAFANVSTDEPYIEYLDI